MTIYKNDLLNRLAPDIITRLDLHRVELPANREIEFPGNLIDNIFFIEEGVASMTTTFADGSQVEVVLAGSESILGTSSLMGTRRSLNRVYMQIGGHGFASPSHAAMREFNRGEIFRDFTLRYLQAQFIQAAQTAGCNARHTVEQRLARWLLLCAHRNKSRILPLSQEYLADMLGVSRTSITVIAGTFQKRNLIQYARGRIDLIDPIGLEKLACECYRVLRNHLGDYAEFDVTLEAGN
jgi:CRP-like cAMP-binding protein